MTILLPGTFGVAHGTGAVAGVIRHATESWAGHAVMYVGGGQVVEARWPKVVQDAAPSSDILWATGQTLSTDQRTAIVAKAKSLVGSGYDLSVYPFLVAAVFSTAVTQDAAHLFASDKWWDCSGLVAECDLAGGANLFPASSPHLVTPANLLDLGTRNGWFQGQALP